MVGLLLVGAIVTAKGQTEQKRERPTAEEMTKRIHSTVELSKEQYNSVLLLNEELIRKMESAGGREADRETKKEIREEHRTKLHSVLNEEQMAKLKEHRKDRPRRQRKGEKKPSEG